MSYSYRNYLSDLMRLWQTFSEVSHLRKYLYLSLGMVLVLGALIGFGLSFINSYLPALGVPLAFLLISGADWLKRRRMLADVYVNVHECECGHDHPEEFEEDEELEDTTELHLDDEDETH